MSGRNLQAPARFVDLATYQKKLKRFVSQKRLDSHAQEARVRPSLKGEGSARWPAGGPVALGTGGTQFHVPCRFTGELASRAEELRGRGTQGRELQAGQTNGTVPLTTIRQNKKVYPSDGPLVEVINKGKAHGNILAHEHKHARSKGRTAHPCGKGPTPSQSNINNNSLENSSSASPCSPAAASPASATTLGQVVQVHAQLVFQGDLHHVCTCTRARGMGTPKGAAHTPSSYKQYCVFPRLSDSFLSHTTLLRWPSSRGFGE